MLQYIKKIFDDLSKIVPLKWIALLMALGALIGGIINLKATPSLWESGKGLSSDDVILLLALVLASTIAMTVLIRSTLNYLEGQTDLSFKKMEGKEYKPFNMELDIETLLKNALKSSLIEDALGIPNTNPLDSRFPTIDQTDALQADFIEKTKHDIKHSQKFSDLALLQNELKSQISRLVANSNINVTIGMSTTIIALSILFFSIYSQHKMDNTLDFLQYFLPRLSTVILIEVISFFFLKLYKNNLSDIKYFQNEITNLNFKLCALKSAIQLEDNETAAAIMIEFAGTERNFILQKGQSTEKLELLKIEQKGEKNMADSIVNVVKSAKEN